MGLAQAGIWIAVLVGPVLTAIVLHELAHGTVADLCGDPTAAEHGRLTLNPLRHLDPVGSVLVPGMLFAIAMWSGSTPFLFGWARPVPVAFHRLRRPRRDMVMVAIAGPATNLVLAMLSTAALATFPRGGTEGIVGQLLASSVVINCILAVFNMFPVPPLDGGRVLQALLPLQYARRLQAMEGVGMVVVVLVVLNTPLLEVLVRPLVSVMFQWAG